jgi:hypothetical protein
MSDQSPERQLERQLLERAGAERYQRYQRDVRSGNGRTGDRARPPEYDANGFPIPQRNPSFLERVARLLNPR